MGQRVITFGGREQPRLASAAAGIIPAPLEATVSYGGGAALGPGAIMSASGQMELYDELLGEEPIARGIYTHLAVDVCGETPEVLERVRRRVATELAEGRLPVVIGGEHTVTLGALAAVIERHGTGFTLLTLDAHLDLRDSYQGRQLSHACVMRRALEMGIAVRWLGTRSCSAAEAEFAAAQGLEPMWARQVHQDGDWLDQALAGLSGPVYLSLDVDGLDPSLMPCTGTPEPGGLDWNQVTDWLLAVAGSHRILGMDLVELAPVNGWPASDFTAARLLYRALGLALRGPR